jgi:hypothetical protein
MLSTRTDAHDPAALGGPLAGLSFIAGVAAGVATATAPFPRPGAKPDQIRSYFTGSARSARLSVAGQVISSAALVPFTAAVARLARRTGPNSSALEAAAIVGGGVAAASLATSAVCSAALTGAWGKEDASAVALHRRAFLAGGPVHTATFGLLVGVLGLAGLRTGELPRPLATAGLVSGLVGILSLLYLESARAVWLIPAGRFSGLLVSGIAGVRLSRRSM